MNIINWMITLSQNHEFLVYLVLFLGAYAETFVTIGFFVFGEVFFVAGGIMAGVGDLNIILVASVCILGGILGDSTGYWLGRKYGARAANFLFKKDRLILNTKNYERAVKFYHSHGKKSVFLGRFTGVFSCIFPFLAGTLHLKYKEFLKYEVPAAIIGISQFLIVGYIFGFSYMKYLHIVEKYVFYGILTVVVLVYVFFKIKKEIKQSRNGNGGRV